MADTTAKSGGIGDAASRLRGPRLIFWGMVVASVALSLGSFYTTFTGMLDILGFDIINGLISAVITFGVQFLLFAMSWRIAESWRLGRMAVLLSMVAWLMCMFISSFFSFYGFFEGPIGGRNEERRIQAIELQVSAAIQEVGDDMRTSLDAGHDAMVDSDLFAEWYAASVEVPIQDAAAVQADLARIGREQSEALQDELRAARQRREGLGRERATLEAEIGGQDRELDRARERFEDRSVARTAASAAVDEIQDRIEALAQAFQIESTTGIGPRAREIQADILSAEAELAAATTALARRDEELRAAEERLAALVAEDGQGTREQSLATLDVEIGEVEALIGQIEAELERTRAQSGFDADRERRQANRLRLSLQSQDYTQYAALVQKCDELVGILKRSPQGSADIACNDTTLQRNVEDLSLMQANLATYQEQCLDAAQPQANRVGEGSAREVFADGIIDFGNRCMQLAQTDLARDAARDLSGLSDTRGDNANPISQGRVALLIDWQINAWLAFFLAITVDLLVLICAIVGRHSGVSETALAIDILTMNTRNANEDGIEGAVTLPSDTNKRRIVDDVIIGLMHEGLAEMSERESDVVLLKPGARARLSHIRAVESGSLPPPQSRSPQGRSGQSRRPGPPGGDRRPPGGPRTRPEVKL
ncbi:MAG: hypothetical protein AAF677_03235 [Pseudomonadota bacterium]